MEALILPSTDLQGAQKVLLSPQNMYICTHTSIWPLLPLPYVAARTLDSGLAHNLVLQLSIDVDS